MKCQMCGQESCSCDKNGECDCGPDCACAQKADKKGQARPRPDEPQERDRDL
jgi:hypothetical protein